MLLIVHSVILHILMPYTHRQTTLIYGHCALAAPAQYKLYLKDLAFTNQALLNIFVIQFYHAGDFEVA